jgi:hypothetical protein
MPLLEPHRIPQLSALLVAREAELINGVGVAICGAQLIPNILLTLLGGDDVRLLVYGNEPERADFGERLFDAVDEAVNLITV